MAILLIRIEDEATLKLNEFFDYNGSCYALSRSREDNDKVCLPLEDFYDCTVRTDWVSDIPVVFIYGKEGDHRILGWYRSSKIYRESLNVSMFLEGNIVAHSSDVVVVPRDCQSLMRDVSFGERLYEVVEFDDKRHGYLEKMMESYSGVNEMKRLDALSVNVSRQDILIKARRDKKKPFDICIEQCALLAERLMNDACEDIVEIKVLWEYAKLAVIYNSQSADGYYYQAMAEEQLGLVRQGLKSIDKALKLEDDGDDLYALKGNLLMAYGRIDEAARMYRLANEIHPLEAYGEILKRIEKQWPFVAVRGFKLKKVFWKRN